MRQPLRNISIIWDKEVDRMVVQVEVPAIEPNGAGRQMEEEMIEELSAVLWPASGMRFEIVSVVKSEQR